MRQLYIDCKKAYDSVRKEVLYNVLIEFGVSTKLFKLIKVLNLGVCFLLRELD
jgi:hypothetical protein